eukprot:Lankesteria_metandrocarpae@DN7387_c0_g1_i1.p1
MNSSTIIFSTADHVTAATAILTTHLIYITGISTTTTTSSSSSRNTCDVNKVCGQDGGGSCNVICCGEDDSATVHKKLPSNSSSCSRSCSFRCSCIAMKTVVVNPQRSRQPPSSRRRRMTSSSNKSAPFINKAMGCCDDHNASCDCSYHHCSAADDSRRCGCGSRGGCGDHGSCGGRGSCGDHGSCGGRGSCGDHGSC